MALTKATRAEEQMLREKFGDTYTNYAQTTGRLIPMLK
jgi:protein-S-isoprenylcysteine O-methyltransferase Ste14